MSNQTFVCLFFFFSYLVQNITHTYKYYASALPLVISLPHVTDGVLSLLCCYFGHLVLTVHLHSWLVLVEEYGNGTQCCLNRCYQGFKFQSGSDVPSGYLFY